MRVPLARDAAHQLGWEAAEQQLERTLAFVSSMGRGGLALQTQAVGRGETNQRRDARRP